MSPRPRNPVSSRSVPGRTPTCAKAGSISTRCSALLEEVLSKGKERFGLTRFWADMEWSLENFPGVDDLVEYESRLNEVTSRFDDVVVCAYDLNRFSATVVMDILRTHPQVIVGGILQENPFYVMPEQFLAELRARNTPVQ